MEIKMETPISPANRRRETRTIINRFYSVEFLVSELGSVYQFVLWDISPNGLCILVEDGSEVLGALKVGDVFRMKYYPQELLGQTRFIKTTIRHVTKKEEERFKNHYKVGLSVLEEYVDG